MNHMETKKAFWHAAIAAIAICSFSACASSEEDELQNSENERGVVKTEFTIAIPQQLRTRMAVEKVQGQVGSGNTTQEPVFLGIQDIKLYPIKSPASSGDVNDYKLPNAVTLFRGATTEATPWYGPSSSTANNQIGQSALNSYNNSHLYQDVEIPIGTKSLLFFGQALRSGSDTEFTAGKLNPKFSWKEGEGNTTDFKLNDIRFEPQSIVGNNTVSDNGQYIATFMTKIAQAEGWSTSTNVALQSLYQSFTSINAGSWTSVKAAVQELYKQIYSRTTEGHGTEDPVSTYSEADSIKKAILNTTIGNTTTKFVTSNSGKELTFVSDETLKTYPREDMLLPDGAARLTYDSEEKTFSAATETGNTGLNIAELTRYVYPAALYYRALSDIRVSDEHKKASYETANSWENVLKAYEVGEGNEKTINRTVTSKTRSIAMDSLIQYAVGRFDITIKAGSFSLKDFAGNSVSATGENFKLTGVFVDGQKAVNYLFKPVGTTSYTIYDKTMSSNIYLTTSASAKNHTLVLESEDAKGPDDRVYIAVEFENNTNSTIIGKNNCIIYPHTKFYLIGKLDPNNSTVKAKDDTSIKKVFIQDYVTTANLSVNSLENAYNVLPDLRAPELELGVSVDLKWQDGTTYNINVE